MAGTGLAGTGLAGTGLAGTGLAGAGLAGAGLAGAGLAGDGALAFDSVGGLAASGFGDGVGVLAAAVGGGEALEGAGVFTSAFGGDGVLGSTAGDTVTGCCKDKGASTRETVCVFHASCMGAPHHQLLAATPNPARAWNITDTNRDVARGSRPFSRAAMPYGPSLLCWHRLCNHAEFDNTCLFYCIHYLHHGTIRDSRVGPEIEAFLAAVGIDRLQLLPQGIKCIRRLVEIDHAISLHRQYDLIFLRRLQRTRGHWQIDIQTLL